MSFDAQRLYDLLPAIYRLRDQELRDQDQPLKSLLSVIAEQIGLLEENLEQRYEDHFVETCGEWVLPYIGDLIGHRPLHGGAAGMNSPRALIANTISHRRRKATAAALEQLARDATGWPACVVESFQLLAIAQHMRHIRPENMAFADLHQGELLEWLDTAFDRVPHTADLRRAASGPGRHNIPHVAVYVWRLSAYPLIDSPAVPAALNDSRRFRFSPLGQDMPLFSRPEREKEITHRAEPINLPQPISRRMLEQYVELYYGRGKSLAISVAGVPIARHRIAVAALSDAADGAWANMPTGDTDKMAIDPERGRLALPPNQSGSVDVQVSFHYGFSGEMGGGLYERRSSIAQPVQSVMTVDEGNPSIQQAIDNLNGKGTVEIRGNGRYEETLAINNVAADSQVQLRAADKCRPTLVPTGELPIKGNKGSEVTIEGCVIVGGIRVPDEAGNHLQRLRLRHCTLVPGLRLDAEGKLLQTDEASLIVKLGGVAVEIEDSILGRLEIHEDVRVRITNSIVDATAPDGVAFAAAGGSPIAAGGSLHIESSTVIGRIYTKQLERAANSILAAERSMGDENPPVFSERTETGCVRFCYVPRDAVVPSRYRCQPDLAIQRALDAAQPPNDALTETEVNHIAGQVQQRMRPAFTSLRYGQPAYAQLSFSCPVEIRTGAEDEAEMGAFRKLYQPQRETELRERLNEYLRFGLEAGIVYVT